MNTMNKTSVALAALTLCLTMSAHAADATPDVADKLAQKIMKGGSGVWGPVPMPANPQVNEAEAKKLAAWVLSLK